MKGKLLHNKCIQELFISVVQKIDGNVNIITISFEIQVHRFEKDASPVQ